MRTFLLFALAALSLPAHARWQVTSEFQLHLSENIFDKIVEDFWKTVQGKQTAGPKNTQFANGPTRVQANGVKVEVDYAFARPKRITQSQREWELNSEQLNARITADQLVITQRQTLVKDGMVWEGDVTVECRDVVLSLPAGNAKVNARIRTEVAQNQVQLTLSDYKAEWPSGSWQVEKLGCPQLQNIQGAIREQIVAYLSNFQNVDKDVRQELTEQFAAWSKEASLLLLSERELPTKSEKIKVHYEPRMARENGGNGLVLGGVLRFEYPFVSPNLEVNQEFKLPEGTTITPQATPQLLVPFATVRALMIGEYHLGGVEYTIRSTEITGFTQLMQNRTKQFFGWPDLRRYAKDTVFLFQFAPIGPPSLEKPKAGSGSTVSANLDIPVAVRMFAPISGVYHPYVEFQTRLKGPTNLTLQKEGKVQFRIRSTEQPVKYAFSKSYVEKYNPKTKIAVNQISEATRDGLNADGMKLVIPSIVVGKQLALLPTTWALQKNEVMQVNFDAGVAPTPDEKEDVKTVKTSNGKILKIRSVRSKRQ